MSSHTRPSDSTFQPPPNGWRTFLITWFTQSISVFGSELTFFALSVWLMQTLYPRPDQKAELAVALSAVSLSFAIPRLPVDSVCRRVGRSPPTANAPL